MAVVGSAYIIVHADTKAVRGEIEKAFSGLRKVAQDAGDQAAKDFSESFSKSLGDELEDVVSDILKQDVTQVARETAADYSDEFTASLADELNDAVSRTLAEDSDGLQRAGEQDADQYASGFSDRLKENFSGVIADALRQDVTTVAEESAADYSDHLTEHLEREMADVVAKTLEGDADGLRGAGERDAGRYATGFSQALTVHLDNLVPDILESTDMSGAGERDGAAYGRGFNGSVSRSSVSPNIDVSNAGSAGQIASALIADRLISGIDRDGNVISNAFEGVGRSAGSSFRDGFGGGIGSLASIFGSPEEIRAASKSITILIGTGNLIGPAIAQAVAGISSLVQGLFSIAAAAAQATPSLIVLPSYLTAIAQAGVSIGIAFNGVGAALKTALTPGVSAADLAEDLDDLVPAAQRFVLAVRDSRDEALKLRDAAARGLFPGVTAALNQLVSEAFPTFRDIVRSTNEAVGDLARTFAERFTDPAALKNLSTLADTNTRSVTKLGTALIDLSEGLASALAAASPLVDRFSSWIGDISASASAFLQVRAATGSLTDSFNNAGDVAAKLGELFGTLTDGIMALGRAAAPAGQGLLDSLQGVAEEFTSVAEASLASGEAFTKWGSVAENVREIGTYFRQLFDILVDIGAADSVAETFQTLQESVPDIRSIAEAFTDAGPALAELVNNALAFVNALTQTEGITAFLNVLAGIFRIVTDILELPVVSQIAQLLVPIVAISRAFQFAWIGIKLIIQGLLLPITLVVGRIGGFTTGLAAARTAGLSMSESIIAGFTGISAAAGRAAGSVGLFTAALTRARTGSILTTATSVGGFAVAPASVRVTSNAVGPVSKLAAKTTLAARATSALRVASIGLIGIPLSPFAAAAAAGIGALGFAYYRAKKDAEEFEAASRETAEALVRGKLATGEYSDELLRQSGAFSEYSNLLGDTASFDEFRENILGSKSELQSLREELIATQASTGEGLQLADGTTLAPIVDERRADEIQEVIDKMQDLRDQMKESRVAMDEEAQAAGFLSFRHQFLATQVEQSRIAFDAVTETMNGVVDANIAGRLSLAQVNVALKNLDTTFGDFGTKNGKFTDQGFLDFTDTYKQLRDISTQLASVGKSNAAEKALTGIRTELRGLVQDGDLSRESFKRLVDQLNLTPEEIEIRVGLQGIQAVAGEIASLKAQRLELLAAGAEEDDAVILQLDLDIEQAEKKFQRLNRKFEGADPTKLNYDADTKEAEKKVTDFLKKRRADGRLDFDASTKKAKDKVDEVLDGHPTGRLDFDADTGKAEKKVQDVLDGHPTTRIDVDAETTVATEKIARIILRKYGIVVDTTADTDKAEKSIKDTVTRDYGTAIVPTDAKTQTALDQIRSLVTRDYGNAVVPVQADVSDVRSTIATAFNSAYQIVASGGGRFSFAALAKGGILPGYEPGKDKIPALLSPGEAVLRPQAVRALGPEIINALNRDWERVSRALRSAWGNNSQKFATGGLVTTSGYSLSDFSNATAAILAATQSKSSGSISGSSTPTIGGDTYIIQPSPGMDEVELAAMVSRRQAFLKRRGT